MAGAKPYSRAHEINNPLARMLPLHGNQRLVYRLGEKNPPHGGMDGYGPVWEAVPFILAARDTAQARVNLQRDFTLLAILTSASSIATGGFRVQLYDTRKKQRLADRGVQRSQMGGDSSGVFFLREPYRFDEPDSQVMVIVQNLETVSNTIQVVLYGQCLRFNESSDHAAEFPGGSISSWGK